VGMVMIFRSHFKRAGFSLISVMISLMALTVTTSLFLLNSTSQNSQQELLITTERIKNLAVAIADYKENNSIAPTNLDQLVTKSVADADCDVDTDTASPTYRQMSGWCGPYLKITFAEDGESFKIDGWGTLFQHTSAYVRSCGPNKTCGDGDDIIERI